jgi:hypothetical protein
LQQTHGLFHHTSTAGTLNDGRNDPHPMSDLCFVKIRLPEKKNKCCQEKIIIIVKEKIIIIVKEKIIIE